MTDFTTITTIDKNFNLEKTIAENHSLRANNKVLVTIAIIMIGVSLYYANEQYKDKKKYIIKS